MVDMFYRIRQKSFGLLIIAAILNLVGELGMAANTAPYILPIANKYISEGESLAVNIFASDYEHDPIAIQSISHPHGSILFDNGNGNATFKWAPEYNGPYSSSASPFGVTIRTSDGQNSSIISFKVFVSNINRKPIINSPLFYNVLAGDTMRFDLAGIDPDNDKLTWRLLNAPGSSVITQTNPGTFVWPTNYNDMGTYEVGVTLFDQFGVSDTVNINLQVIQTDIYTLTIDTVSTYPMEKALININLDNRVPIFGFDILFNYDFTGLILSSISKAGTRAENFEYFTYNIDNKGMPGDVRLVGISDVAGGAVIGNLPTGNGPVAKILFYATNDQNFSGFSIPLRFVFRDFLNYNDNTMTDSVGGKIPQSSILYYDGYVSILAVTANDIGDINLNSIPYEIGDAIYLTGYFLSPAAFPFNAVQRANADVNQDGYAPTVADLVYLINRLAGIGALKQRYDNINVDVALQVSDGKLNLNYDSPVDLGGIFVTMKRKESKLKSSSILPGEQVSKMIFESRNDGDYIRILIYSKSGNSMTAGQGEIFSIENLSDYELEDIQVSSSEGYMLPISLKDGSGSELPNGFELCQNYPNPFNPSTTIRFNLPVSSAVKLTVYDVLGREVRTIADGQYMAGYHEIMWDGLDGRGSTVSSGIYFYELKTGEFSSMRKMMFLK
jgi:hypothetical protein